MSSGTTSLLLRLKPIMWKSFKNIGGQTSKKVLSTKTNKELKACAKYNGLVLSLLGRATVITYWIVWIHCGPKHVDLFVFSN